MFKQNDYNIELTSSRDIAKMLLFIG